MFGLKESLTLGGEFRINEDMRVLHRRKSVGPCSLADDVLE
jgi:hypothetical protein